MEAVPGDQLAMLEQRRAEGAVSSIEFAVQTVVEWAVAIDEAHPIEDATVSGGSSHVAIVEEMLANTAERRAAVQRGYFGAVQYPVNLDPAVSDTLNGAFSRSIHRRATNSWQADRLRSIDMAMAAADITDGQAQAYRSFAELILGAHSLYNYLFTRIRGEYVEFKRNAEGFRIVPGFEMAYWRSRIFGANKLPGIYETDGSLLRLSRPIHDRSAALYDQNMDGFISAWWATVNLFKDDSRTYDDTFNASLAALLRGDYGASEFAIKECLFLKPRLLPHGSRERFELTDGERAFFAEMYEEQAELSEAGLLDDELVRLTPEAHEEARSQAQAHVGSVVMWETLKGQLRMGVIRSLGVQTVAQSDPVVEIAGVFYELTPYALTIDYLRGSPEEGRLEVEPKARGRSMTVGRFVERLRNGHVIVLASDTRYTDSSITTIEIPNV